MKLAVKDQAPDFNLPDQNGEMHSLKKYHGQYVLLYFYPKDDTPGCTKEACSFRDNFSKFSSSKVLVFGISIDSVKSHKKFEEKYQLTFPLLSDEKKEVVQAYGVWGIKKFVGREYEGIRRSSFIVDPKGKIAYIFEDVKPEGHAEEVLGILSKISAS